MEIRQLQYFVAMFEEGSVTRAARRLNVVQPALSQQLAKLEEELGQPLFHRTPKGMVPTRAGAEAYALFLVVLKDLEYARQSLAERKGVIRGHVSIGVVSSVLNNALSETLQAFNTKYPEVTIRATGGYTTDLLEMLRTSQVDAVVINASKQQEGANTIDILTEDLALVCSADNPLQFDGPVPLADIARLTLAIPSRRHGLRLIIDQAAEQEGVTLKPPFEFDELKTIEDFVQSTDFFTIMPPIAVHRAIRHGRLRHHAITPNIPRRLICMYNPNRPPPRVVELLIAALRERMIEVTGELEATLAIPR
ncbi:LysR family transcriptional regulator (plasmid) [Phyllobacteriaceae bacterium JZ32]